MRHREYEQLQKGRVTGLSRTVLDHIKWYRERKGFSPTVRELKASTGLATQTIVTRLKELERAGFICRTPGAARSIVVVQKDVQS